jgi:hypothetical protein
LKEKLWKPADCKYATPLYRITDPEEQKPWDQKRSRRITGGSFFISFNE